MSSCDAIVNICSLPVQPAECQATSVSHVLLEMRWLCGTFVRYAFFLSQSSMEANHSQSYFYR